MKDAGADTLFLAENKMNIAWGAKPVAVAALYGGAAGAIAALVFALMKGAQHVLWSSAWVSPWANAPGYIFAVIMLGGVLLAGLQYLQENLARGAGSKVQQAAQQRRKIALVAASAIVAIGFGGAIGPEAGLLAVVAECAAIVSDQLAAAYAQTRSMSRWGEGAAQPARGMAQAAGAARQAQPPAGTGADMDAGADARPAPPQWLNVLAAVCGTAAFYGTNKLLTGSRFQQLPLPDYVSFGLGADALLALPAALAGALLGLLFVWLHHKVPDWLQIIPRPSHRILAGTAIFAALAAAFPLLRFSGHHELEHALEHGIHANMWILLGLGVGKVAAMAVCLASGWRGGEIFPVLFAGAAVAAAVHVLVPGIPLTVALIGGMCAASTVCTGKPVAVLLVMLLLAGVTAPAALLTGVVTGYGVRRLLWSHAKG